jgi:hypothetical protein
MSAERRVYGPVQVAEFLGLARWQFDRARTAGTIPDVGAGRAAEILSDRLGVPVTPAGVVELSRRGVLPEVGSYKGWPLYSGLAIEGFTYPGVATEASSAGQLRTADASARYLRIRRTDFNHLTRLGLLTPTEWCPGPFDSSHRCRVPLYRAADLDAVRADTRIDWASVRSTQSRRHSPLARLTRGDLAALTPRGATS